MIELKPIRVSKDLIQEPLKFEKELGLRFFKECILKFNQIENLDKEIIFSFDELRKNFQLKNTEDFKEFMKFFHTEIDGRKNIFTTDKGDLIGGGVFSTKIYVDRNDDGKITDDDKRVYDRSPKCILGWNNTLTYKDFSLSFLVYARLGGWMEYGLYQQFRYDNANWADLDYWTPENQGARFPTPGLTKQNTYAASTFYEK